MKLLPLVRKLIALALLAGAVALGVHVYQALHRERVLARVIGRLEADSRVAEVVVTAAETDPATQTPRTTIKFLEYDVDGKPLHPRYFTFQGSVIQFQALVVRFLDELVEVGDRLRGKSAYIFLKAFALGDAQAQVFEINRAREIPSGYKIEGLESAHERKLWEILWEYVLDSEARKQAGIKNVQIEAPGSVFRPGTIYTIVIEHDGGLRIDASPVPEILKGEKVLP